MTLRHLKAIHIIALNVSWFSRKCRIYGSVLTPYCPRRCDISPFYLITDLYRDLQLVTRDTAVLLCDSRSEHRVSREVCLATSRKG
jgi:hypothetical protein